MNPLQSDTLLRNTAVTGGMTLLSRCLGLLRDILFARLFGAGLDTFLVALRLPNFLRRLFAEGGLVQAFVPVLTEYRLHRERSAVQALIAQLSAILGVLLCVLALLGMLCAPLLIWLFAPGFYGDVRHAQAAAMLRITFPYLPLIALTALAGAILNSWGRFAAPAFTPALFNLSLIGCALWLSPMLEMPVHALAWGVLLAGVLQLLFLAAALARSGLLVRPRWRSDRAGARRIARLMLPTLFGSSVTQINTLVDTLIASFLAAGSISWLYYADRLMEFPLGVFGIALSTVLLPALARCHAAGDDKQANLTLDWALRWVMLISIPAAAGLIILAEAIITTLFQYDQFTLDDVHRCAAALAAYAIGLPGLVLVKVLATAYYSRQQTATPVRFGMIAVGVNLSLNLLLVYSFAHVGLAMATAMAAWVQALLLYRGLSNAGLYRPGPGWPWLLLSIVAACLVMTVALRLQLHTDWTVQTALERALHLGVALGTGVALYLGTMLLLGQQPPRLAVEPPD